MIIRTQTVRFSPDRKPMPRRIRLGFEGDNMVERLAFELPAIADSQTATLMMGGAYANAVQLAGDGVEYYTDLTAEIVGAEGETEAYVRIDGADGEVWQSDVISLITGDVPDVEAEIEQRFPTAVETMLQEMAGHRVEMEQQTQLAEDAVRRAEEAAERAEGAGSGTGGIIEETDPTVPVWAKQPEKPKYTAEEVGAQPKGDYALKSELPSVPVQSVNGQTGAVVLDAADVSARPDTWMPSAAEVGADAKGTAAAEAGKALDAAKAYADGLFDGGAEAPDVSGQIEQHNADQSAHLYIRELVAEVEKRLNALADSDDTTLDQLSEIVAYIKSNKSLIDAITTGKVSVGDIVNNLTTNAAGKVLSAAQGVVLRTMIEAITVPTKLSELTSDAAHRTVTDSEKAVWDEKLDADKLPEAVEDALAQAKASGEFDGKPGEDGYTPIKGVDYFDGKDGAKGADGVSATHSWNGTTLTVTSASGTSSANLKGEKGSDATVTASNIADALGYTPLKASGWGAGKNLGTDESGNVIEKEDIFSKDISAWSPVEYMNGIAWTELGYYWTVNGTHTSTQYTTDFQSTQELIRIDPNCSYTLSNFAGVYFLYDSSGKNGVASTLHSDPNTAKSFETNANQYYIGISHKPGGSYTVERVSLVRTTISQAEYDALPTRADSLKSLYGKKVVCFGDSLFGMYRGDDSAPAFVAAETGATVYNVGFGGCRMAVHYLNGYAAFSMWALAKAIAEDNWTEQDAQASSGSAYFPEQLALLKSIDFSKVDAAVIHYGTNDFAAASSSFKVDNTSDPDDYNTLCGALRYSIEKLLGAYPKLRIYVSLPVYRYWTDNGTEYAETYTNSIGKTLPDFVEALRGVAAEYNLPVIDGYYGLGINKANAAAFLSDGTHHNVIGRERFGRFIGANLIAQQTSGKSGMDIGAVQTMIDDAIGAAIGGVY